MRHEEEEEGIYLTNFCCNLVGTKPPKILHTRIVGFKHNEQFKSWIGSVHKVQKTKRLDLVFF